VQEEVQAAVMAVVKVALAQAVAMYQHHLQQIQVM
jgi:hypothetical protein